MTERSQDVRPELVLKAGGELRVHFKEAADANVFILLFLRHKDTIIPLGVETPEDES